MAHPIGPLDQPTLEALALLGSVLRDLRALHGLTQRQLARRCGLDQSTISRLENGKAPGVRAAWIARLLAGLERPPYWPGEEPWNRRTPPGWVLLMERFAARRRHLARLQHQMPPTSNDDAGARIKPDADRGIDRSVP
jgi:transcriptional regulator with XRE-family HTH domain